MNNKMLGEKENCSLLESLSKYCDGDSIAMHMPGHKRNVDAFPYLKAQIGAIDITEIKDFDDLHNANGILKLSMDIAAELFKTKKSWYLLNGSTCGILSAIRALTKRGEQVVVARNCHKAVYNALELCGLRSIYVEPQRTPYGINGSISVKSIKQAFSENNNISLVILTSPTYEGVISDVGGISDVAHAHGARVFVDGAHGAHLDLSQYFVHSGRNAGADVVVESLHKTLPSPTQTAILHLCSNNAPCSNSALEKEIEAQLSVFETSSPSYALMSAIDGCIRFLCEDNGKIFKKLSDLLCKIEEKANELVELKILGYGKNKCLDKSIFAFDRTKIVVMREGACSFGNEGNKIEKHLRDKFAIECEMSKDNYAIAMTCIGDTEISIDRLVDAIVDCEKKCVEGLLCQKSTTKKSTSITMDKDISITKDKDISINMDKCATIKKAFYPWEIENMELETVTTACATSRISAEYIWAYPPGVPLIVPGEILSDKMLKKLLQSQCGYERLHSTYGGFPAQIVVVK